MRVPNGRIFSYNCLTPFDLTDSLQTTLLFFFLSRSRIDKSETQYKQQMGQSLAFVSMSPIAIGGEETKQDPQTHLSFFYYMID